MLDLIVSECLVVLEAKTAEIAGTVGEVFAYFLMAEESYLLFMLGVATANDSCYCEFVIVIMDYYIVSYVLVKWNYFYSIKYLRYF